MDYHTHSIPIHLQRTTAAVCAPPSSPCLNDPTYDDDHQYDSIACSSRGRRCFRLALNIVSVISRFLGPIVQPSRGNQLSHSRLIKSKIYSLTEGQDPEGQRGRQGDRVKWMVYLVLKRRGCRPGKK